MSRIRWRWRTVALGVVVTVGCGETSKNGQSGNDGPSTGGLGNSLATANTGPTTGNTTRADSTNTTHGDWTSTTSSSTNAVTAVSAGGASVATSTAGGASTTQAGGSGGSGGSGTDGSGGSGGGAAGGGAEPECSSDDDCRLFSDCCSCAAYPSTGEAPEACPAECAQGRCDQYRIEQARCFAGSCIVATPHSCSPLPVECDSMPPECAEGTLPSVGSDQCWTGDCIPADLCGWRPNCSSCAEGEVCFRGFNDAIGAPYYCIPRPVTCNDQATCGCASQLCEELGFSGCTDASDGVMQCSP